jgi:hypothetical protein
MGLRKCIIGIALLTACGGGGGPAELPWTVVTENQPSSLLSVWGSSTSDVWVVGADARDGAGPFVAHYDGAGWTKLDSGERNVDLWWVKGFDGGPVFMSGSNGTILKYENGAFTKLPTPGSLIVFGMWGEVANDVWAVGGNFAGGGFAWRFDGTAWTNVDAVPADITSQGTCFKVNGLTANDLWISGTNGTTLHWNGTSLDREDVPVEASLLSVGGNSKRFITVGGAFDGVIYENEGDGWKSAISGGGPVLTGVAVSEDDAYAVGQFGTVLRRGSTGWKPEPDRVTDQNLHATWIDPDGGVWAVGGHFDTPPMTAGVLIHKGEPLAGTL